MPAKSRLAVKLAIRSPGQTNRVSRPDGVSGKERSISFQDFFFFLHRNCLRNFCSLNTHLCIINSGLIIYNVKYFCDYFSCKFILQHSISKTLFQKMVNPLSKMIILPVYLSWECCCRRRAWWCPPRKLRTLTSCPASLPLPPSLRHPWSTNLYLKRQARGQISHVKKKRNEGSQHIKANLQKSCLSHFSAI